jgi:O-antigen/teichoic acid export membrane protein
VLQLGGIAAAVATARILGQTGFGELGMVRSTVLMFGVFAGTGLGMAATKYVAEFRENDPTRAGRILGLLLNVATGCGGLATVLCFILASPLAGWVMDAEHLADPLRVGCLLILLNAVNGVQLGALNGCEAFRIAAWIGVFDALSNLAFMVLGGWLFGVVGAVGGSILAAASTFPIKNTAMRRECQRNGITINRRSVGVELSVLWSFALPTVLIGVAAQPFEWLARLILSRQPNGYAELGSLLAAYSWGQAVLFLPNQVTAPSLPLLANLWSNGDTKRLRHTLVITFIATAVASISACVLLVFFRWRLMALYGESFASATPVLFSIAAAFTVGGSALAFRALLVASGRVWLLLLSTCVWGGVFILFSMAWAGDKALGIGDAYLVAYGFHFVILACLSIFTLQGFGRKAVRVTTLSAIRADSVDDN